ncbi:MAG: hypothetical protein WCK13_12630 [Ignavibacteriota bacterium]
MLSVPLKYHEGHLFTTIDSYDWLLDTGAPASFGKVSQLSVENKIYNFPESYMGLTASALSEYVGHSTAGIIGADVLNNFDTLFDVPDGIVTFSELPLSLNGTVINTEEFMGIPIIDVKIDGINRRMFFDSGAQTSYFQDDSLANFPVAGTITDFFPGIGQFQTETYHVDINIAERIFTLRCGFLPGLLGMTLMMADTEGIIGSEILRNNKAGYFSRRKQLVIV